MLWPREEFHAAYGQIKHDALQSGGALSVLILVALDVDALCASAILTSLLKADFVSYTLLPVRGYEDIVRIRDVRIASPSASELKSIVMINCGAIVNIAQLLQLPTHVKCYIFDSHRPIHLANIYDTHQQIVVFDDGAQSIEEFPEDGSDIERDEFEESDGEDGDDDDDDDDDEEAEDEEEEEEDEDEGEAEVDFGETTNPTEETEEKENAEEPPASSSGSTTTNEKKRKRSGDDDGDGDGEDADDGTDQDGKEEDGEDDNASEGDHSSGDEDDDAGSPKRHRAVGDGIHVQEMDDTASASVDHKQAKRQRREAILRYYRGSFHGAPAASIAFELAQQMNAGAHRDLLWFAIVGLTKQFVMEEIDADNYNLMIHRFQDEVLALDASASGGGSGAGEDDSQSVVNPAYEHGRISFEEEYRFMCYRHWSLYEAMYYSDYIAAKLGLYMDQARRFGARNAVNANGDDDGETTLHVFLARMGFSLRQSQQKFTYMPLEMKKQLRDKIQEIAPEFGLEDVFYGSFKRQFAFQYLLGAADAVHGLQALLEAPEAYIQSVFQAENHHKGNALQQPLTSLYSFDSKGITKTGDADAQDEDSDVAALRDFKHQNFFLASTALSCRSVASSSLMESGIKVAMELKQAIVRVGISIMERKLIVRVKHFRYVCLTIPEREQELFANANVLTQLALFLLTVHRASGKWGGRPITAKKTKKSSGDGGDDDNEDDEEDATQQKPIVPLVLITRNPTQNSFLVVGITCPNNPGEVHRNTLGTAFRLAAGETGASFRQDGFSSAVLEIQMDDIQYFVEQLHNVMDA